jgi:hypothetical protein
MRRTSRYQSRRENQKTIFSLNLISDVSCYLGWQESLALLKLLVKPRFPIRCKKTQPRMTRIVNPDFSVSSVVSLP